MIQHKLINKDNESESDEEDFGYDFSDVAIGDIQEEKAYERVTMQVMKITQLQHEIDLRLAMPPYFYAINELRLIPTISGPLAKTRCIVKTSGIVVKSINSFWRGLKIKKEKLTIDGDSMLMIYIFLTVKAGFAV